MADERRHDRRRGTARLSARSDRILDPTWGLGRFWTRWKPWELFGSVFDPAKSPSAPTDFRHLEEWVNGYFGAVTLDGPYKLNGTATKAVDGRYGVDTYASPAERHGLICDGMTECTRVLKVGGVLLVKCKDQVKVTSPTSIKRACGWLRRIAGMALTSKSGPYAIAKIANEENGWIDGPNLVACLDLAGIDLGIKVSDRERLCARQSNGQRIPAPRNALLRGGRFLRQNHLRLAERRAFQLVDALADFRGHVAAPLQRTNREDGTVVFKAAEQAERTGAGPFISHERDVRAAAGDWCRKALAARLVYSCTRASRSVPSMSPTG